MLRAIARLRRFGRVNLYANGALVERRGEQPGMGGWLEYGRPEGPGVRLDLKAAPFAYLAAPARMIVEPGEWPGALEEAGGVLIARGLPLPPCPRMPEGRAIAWLEARGMADPILEAALLVVTARQWRLLGEGGRPLAAGPARAERRAVLSVGHLMRGLLREGFYREVRLWRSGRALGLALEDEQGEPWRLGGVTGWV